MRVGERFEELDITVDGRTVRACAGDTVAAAMLAAGLSSFRKDANGRVRGILCNMGTCCECFVAIDGRRVRACLAEVKSGMEIATRA